MQVSKLPFWYLIGVIVVILVSIVNYFGMRNAIKNSNIILALRFQYMDYLLIGLWFAINVIILFYLISSKAQNTDFIFPIYFIIIHAFYVLIIVSSYYEVYLSKNIATLISIVTSVFELSLAFFFLLPYLRGIGANDKQTKTNINKRKPRPKKQ